MEGWDIFQLLEALAEVIKTFVQRVKDLFT